MTVVALYVRVSTEEQAMEGYSVDAQKDILGNYCIAQGFEVHDIYVDDGFSGRNTRRPGYRRMMEDIASWDSILVLKMDRIHRNSRNFMDMMDALERRHKGFISATEDLDTSNAMGRFVVAMIQSIAQLESEQIGERTYIGMKQKAETLENAPDASRTMGMTSPYGYVIDGGMLVAVPGELETVKRVFSGYLKGWSLARIAESVNRDGVRTRRGNRWAVASIRTLLHNPIYAGYMRWDGVEIRHYATPAVTVEDYNAVQTLMASKVKDPKKRKAELLPAADDFDPDERSGMDVWSESVGPKARPRNY